MPGPSWASSVPRRAGQCPWALFRVWRSGRLDTSEREGAREGCRCAVLQDPTRPLLPDILAVTDEHGGRPMREQTDCGIEVPALRCNDAPSPAPTRLNRSRQRTMRWEMPPRL